MSGDALTWYCVSSSVALRGRSGRSGSSVDAATLRAKSRFFWKTASTLPSSSREREAGPAAAERAAGRRLALVQLRRPRRRAVLVVRVVGRLAVGDVEVGRPLRDVRVHRGVAVRAGDRLEPRV